MTTLPQPFHTWLALSLHTPDETKRQIIAARRAFLEEQQIREQAHLHIIENYDSIMARAGSLMVRHKIRQYTVELLWLDDVAREIFAET